MKIRLAAASAILLMIGTSASAHRLDEYLQATTISMERDRVQAQIRLTPGAAVLPIVLPSIDTDADGVISEAEQWAYAERVLGDLSLTIDDKPLRLQLVSLKFANIQEMKEGLGEIQLELNADVSGGGPNRRLIFENRHQGQIAAYLVNCLVPSDPGIRITAQDRNYQQSFYQLDYLRAGVHSGPQSSASWSISLGSLGAAVLLMFAGFAYVRQRARSANDAMTEQRAPNSSSKD